MTIFGWKKDVGTQVKRGKSNQDKGSIAQLINSAHDEQTWTGLLQINLYLIKLLRTQKYKSKISLLQKNKAVRTGDSDLHSGYNK